tara:strand:+ start:87619 stop:88758 length:1140 start_codon:yes stop_codon:yes gene_type:complete
MRTTKPELCVGEFVKPLGIFCRLDEKGVAKQMANRMRWGLVGTGTIAHDFARDMERTSGAELVAVCSRDRIRATEFARHHDVVGVFTDLDAMLATGAIDALYLATPSAVHHEQAIAALIAGKPVLVEKPLSVDAQQAREMVRMAQKHSVFLMEALWTRYLPAISAIRALLDAGTIGTITGFEANLAFRQKYNRNNRFFSPELGGGSLLDLGVYPLSLALSLLGLPLASRGNWRAAPSGVDRLARVTLFYRGYQALLSCGFDRNGANLCIIHGSSGMIVIDGPFLQAKGFFVIRNAMIARLFAAASNPLAARLLRKLMLKIPVRGVERHSHDFPGNGLQFEIEAASTAIRDGRIEEPLMAHEHSIAVQDIIQSVLANRPV